MQWNPFVPIQYVHKRKPDCCKTKTIQHMQDRIPMRNGHIKIIDFTQDISGKHKTQDDDFQGAWQGNIQLLGQDAWQKQQKECEYRNKNGFIVPVEKRKHACQHNRDVQRDKDDDRAPVGVTDLKDDFVWLPGSFAL